MPTSTCQVHRIMAQLHVGQDDRILRLGYPGRRDQESEKRGSDREGSLGVPAQSLMIPWAVDRRVFWRESSIAEYPAGLAVISIEKSHHYLRVAYHVFEPLLQPPAQNHRQRRLSKNCVFAAKRLFQQPLRSSSLSPRRRRR